MKPILKEAVNPEGAGSDSDPCHQFSLDKELEKVHAYGLTIKPCSQTEIKKTTQDTCYLSIILTKFLCDNHFKLMNSNIEYDSHGTQHIHCTFTTPTRIKLYRNLKIKNFHLHIEKIYNLQRWLTYCQKDDAMVRRDIEYYQNNYGFI